MKQYQKNKDDGFSFEGMTIPNTSSNRHYQQMQKEIVNEEAEILPYIEPDPPYAVPSVQDQLDALFENTTLTGAADVIKGRVLNRPGRN